MLFNFVFILFNMFRTTYLEYLVHIGWIFGLSFSRNCFILSKIFLLGLSILLFFWWQQNLFYTVLFLIRNVWTFFLSLSVFLMFINLLDHVKEPALYVIVFTVFFLLFLISLIFFWSLFSLLFIWVVFSLVVSWGVYLDYQFEIHLSNISFKFYKFPSQYCFSFISQVLICFNYISFTVKYSSFETSFLTHKLFRSM